MSAAGRLQATNIVVNTLTDDAAVEVNADGKCSFREALKALNDRVRADGCPAGSGSDQITFSVTGVHQLRLNKALKINRSVTITGRGAGKTEIVFGLQGSRLELSLGDALFKPFVFMSGVKLSAATRILVGAGSWLGLADSDVVSQGWGSIDVSGGVSLASVLVQGLDGGFNGALIVRPGANADVRDSALIGNGGEHGAAISTEGRLSVLNSTISGNKARGQGGAISVLGGTTDVRNSTLAFNQSAHVAGGILVANGGTVTLLSSILANNQATDSSPDCQGPIQSAGYNIVGHTSGCGISASFDQLDVNPQLDPTPAKWGGRTPLHRLLAFSPAIDRGFCTMDGDQRGVLRWADGDADGTADCDVGAFEWGHAMLVVGSTNLGAGDAALKAHLENTLAYQVQVAKDDVVESFDAEGASLVIISESVASASVNSKFKWFGVPVLALEQNVFDDMSLTGPVMGTNFGTTGGQTQIRIADPTHAMAAGFDGTVTVTTSGSNFGWGVGLPSDAEEIAATAGDWGRKTIFGYRAGGILADGTSESARRVGFFASQPAVASLTTDGWKLMDAAILWCGGVNN
jgi:CSLREA domain-containing protein